MSRLDTLRARFEAATQACEQVDQVYQGGRPDTPSDDDITSIVDAAYSVDEWLEVVRPYIDAKLARQLRGLALRIIDERATLLEARGLEPLVEQASAQLQDSADTIESMLEDAQIAYEEELYGDDNA